MVAIDYVFDSKVNNVGELFKLKSFKLILLLTMLLQNAGRTLELRLQQHCRFGLGLDKSY